MANHVDNRVVQMQFDNSRFEKNIQTSINSLDKFKESLNFDGASQSLDQLEKSTGNLDFSKMEASLAALEHRFSALGIAGMTLVTDLTRSVERAAGKITNFVKSNVLEGGWQRAANIENAKFQLEGIGVAWKDVADDIDYAVAGTAYGLDEAAQACGRLATAGIAAGDDMKKALRGISGVAAMSGSSYAEIADIFSDAASKGRVMSMELTRLEERGIAASTMLQKELGMTGDEFDKFVRKGQLDFDTFSQAMDDAFGEHAKDANKTFDGALANLRAAFKKIGAEVATPLRDYLRDLFNAIRTTVNTVKSALMPTLEDISIILYRIIHPIQEIFESATAAESIMKVIEVIKNLIGAIALPLIEVKNAFKDIFNNSAVKGATSLLDKILEFSKGLVLTGDNAKNFRDTFKGVFAVIDIVAQALSAVVKAIFPASSGFGSIGAAILNFTGNIGRFIVVIDEWIKKNDIFTKGIEKLKTFVGPAFGAVAGVLTKVKDALKGFFDAFKSGLNLDSETNKFERFGRLKDILNGVGAVFKFIGEQIKKVAPLFVSIGGIIKEALEQVGRAVHQAISGNGFNGMLDLLNAFLTSGIVALVAKFMNNLEDAVGAPAKIIKKVVPFITDIQNTLKTFQMSLKADILMTIAKAVGILTLSLIGLSLIDSAKLTRNLAAVAGVIFMLVTAMESISRVLDSGFMSGKKGLSGVLENIGMSATKSANYVSLGKALVSLATAVAILSGSLIALSFVKPEKMGQALLALTVVMGELTGVMLILSNYGGKAKTSAMAMVGMGAAVAIIAGALKKLASIDPNGMTQALEAFTAIMLELGLFSVTAGQIGKGVKQAASALLTMSIALNVIALAFKQMQGLDMKQVGTALTAFGGIMAEFGVLAGAMKAFKIDNFGSVAASLIALGVALNLIASAVNSVGSMGLADLAKGIIGLGVAMAGMVVTLSALTGVAKALGGGTMLAAAASMILLATAFDLLAPALLMLGSASLGTVVKGLIAFGGAMMVLAIAGQALVGAVGPILALGAAVLMIGGGVALAGAGIALFATALAALTAVVIGASAAIPMLASAITQFVAAAITGIGEGIITVIKLFNEAVPSLVELVKNVIVSILNAINEMVGPLAESVVLIVAAVVKILVEAVPTIVDGVLTILVGVLTAIRDHIQDIASLALEIIAEFLRGLASGIGNVIDAGMELGIAFINGLADGIENNGEAFEAAVEHLITAVLSTLEKTLPKFLSFGKDIILNIVKGIGNLALELVRFVGNIGLKILEAFGVPDDYIQMAKDFMDGFIDGLKQKWGDLINWVKDIADSVIDGFKGIFGIHSPSTVMAEIGELLDDGLAKGIKDNKGSVLDVVEEISGDVTDKFGDMKDAGIASAEEMNNDMSEEMDGLADNAEASANRAYSAWEYAMAAIRGRSVELQHTLNSLADKYEAIDKINNQVAESTEEVVEEEEDLTEATTKAGGSASKTSKEEEKLQKALEAMLKTVPVVIHEYEELYEVMYLTEEGANAGQEALEALGVTLEEFGDFYENVGKKVESALDNIFDTPKDRGWMDKNALLKNMQENYNQVSQWADTIGKLAEKGLDSGLYKKLGEMGPEGYKYVHAFMEMTEDEIAQANKIWGDAAELKPAVQNRVAAGWLNTGLMATQGLANGMEEGKDEVYEKAAELGDAADQGLRSPEGLDTNSPSRKTEEVGKYAGEGLALGLEETIERVAAAATVMGNQLVDALRNAVLGGGARLGANGGTLESIGQQVVTKIAAGMVLNASSLDEITLDLVGRIAQAIETRANEINQNGRFICKHLVTGFRDEMLLQMVEIDAAIDEMIQEIVDEFTSDEHEKMYTDMVVFFVKAICDEIINKKTTYKSFTETFDEFFTWLFEDILMSEERYETFVSAGAYWMEGLAQGIMDNAEAAYAAAREVAENVAKITMSGLEEKSPSKLAKKIGKWWDEGLEIGIKGGAEGVYSAATALTDGVVNVANISQPKVRKAFTKMFNGLEQISTKKVAKTLAKITNQVTAWKISDTVVEAIMPAGQAIDSLSDRVTKKAKNISVKVDATVRDVQKRLNQAIKFANKLDTNIKNYTGIDTLVKKLDKIKKFYNDFEKVPPKITTFLKNLQKEMKPTNNLMDHYLETMIGTNETHSDLTETTNSARKAFLEFGAAILNNTQAGEEYAQALEDVANAEEALSAAEEKGEGIGEAEEALAAAEAKLTSYTKAVSKAVKEFKNTIRDNLIGGINTLEGLTFGTDLSSANSILGNTKSYENAYKKWGDTLKELALKGMPSDIMQTLLEKGIDGIDETLTYNQLSDKQIAIMQLMREKAEEQAKKTAKDAVSAGIYSYSDEAKKHRQEIVDSFNMGDRVWMEMWDGGLDALNNFVEKYKYGLETVLDDTNSTTYQIGDIVYRVVNNTLIPTEEDFLHLMENLSDEMKDMNPILDQLGKRFLGVADYSKEMTLSALDNRVAILQMADSLGMVQDAAESTESYIKRCTNAIVEWRDSIKETVESQMNPFEKFNTDFELTGSELLDNMQSNLTGIENWASNIETLAERGMSSALLKYLAELGPASAEMVNAFVSMTDSQLGEANDMWEKILKIPDDVSTRVAAALGETATDMGKAAQEGLAKAFELEGSVRFPYGDSSSEESQAAVEAAGETGYEAGSMIVSEEANALNDGMPTIIEAVSRNASAVTDAFSDAVSSSSITTSVSSSISNGVSAGVNQAVSTSTSAITSAMRTLSSEIVRIFEECAKNSSSAVVNKFQEAVNKIKDMINTIPKNIDIKVTMDTSEAEYNLNRLDTAIDDLNYKIQQLNKAAQSAASSVNSSSSSSTVRNAAATTASTTSTGSSGTNATVNVYQDFTTTNFSRSTMYRAAKSDWTEAVMEVFG